MTRIYRTFGTVTAAVLANVSMFGQAALQPIIISATEPRPLESVGKLFERRFGIPVSYEDAAYAYSGDVIDQTSQEYKKAHPEARALSPKGGRVELRGQLGAPVRTPSEAKVMLQAAVDDHKKSGNPGEFTLLQDAEGVVIVPVSVRNSNGVLVPNRSPLEVNITFPELQRSPLETLEVIATAIRAASGERVEVMSAPFQGLASKALISIGAANEQARSVLTRTLSTPFSNVGTAKVPQIKLAWRLLYDPGQRTYGLNVHQVMVEATSPTGATILRPVTR